MRLLSVQIVFAVFSVLVLNGCLGKDDEEAAVASCSQSSLTGTWVRACHLDSGGGGGGGTYRVTTLAIAADNSFSYSEQDYSDAACTSASGSPSAMTGTFTVGGCGHLAGSNILTITPSGSGDVGCGAGIAHNTIYKIVGGTSLYFGNDGGSSGCGTPATGYDTYPMVKI